MVVGAGRSRWVPQGVVALSYLAPFGSWLSDFPTVRAGVDGTSDGRVRHLHHGPAKMPRAQVKP